MPSLFSQFCAQYTAMRQWFLHPGSLGIAVAVAVVLRVMTGLYFESRLPAGQTFEFGDSDGYWVLGQAISAGEPYQYHSAEAQVFRMPGYPTMLAPLFLLFGQNVSPYWGRVLSAILGGLTVVAVAWWAALLFDDRAATIAGWMTALYPGAVAMGSFVLSEAPFMPFMALHLAFTTAAHRSESRIGRIWFSIGAGIFAAAAIYMRPSWILFVPFALTLGLLFGRNRTQQLIQNGIALAVICVCLIPWWIRNYQVTGHLVPTTLQVGASLYDGWNPNANGGSNMDFSGDALADYCRERGYGNPAELDEYTLNQSYRGMAVDWAKANPWRAVSLALIKFTRMWNIIPNEPMFRSTMFKLIVAATYGPLLAIGLYGWFKFNRKGWNYLLPILPAVYFTFLHIIFVSGIRYREPAMLGILVLASGVIEQWTRGNVAGKLQFAN